MVGGYYDAGDHVKFGLPMAFTATMLSWSVIDFRKEITNLNQMGHALWSIRWATDYFIKAHPQPNVLWAQVTPLGLEFGHPFHLHFKLLILIKLTPKHSYFTPNSMS